MMRKTLLMLLALLMLVGVMAPLASPALAAEPQITLAVDGMI